MTHPWGNQPLHQCQREKLADFVVLVLNMPFHHSSLMMYCLMTSPLQLESTLRMDVGVALDLLAHTDLGSVPLGYINGVSCGGMPK
jgi:hypothetical protein